MPATSLSEWRQNARILLANDIHPYEVMWNDDSPQQTLFPSQQLALNGFALTITKQFLSIMDMVACHRHPERWNLLYHALWRLTHDEKNLLHITTDPLVYALHQMQQSVRRDAHKAKAFVRFRQTRDADDTERYVAWHRPDHYILPLVAPFFQRRFSSMLWSILTPDASVWWDGTQLHFDAGVEAATVAEDALEDVWRSYYKAIFNPARVSISAMKREMPMRHWATLPETSVIAELLENAPKRMEKMIAQFEGSLISAANFLPADRSLPSLRMAAASCQGCSLHRCATQTVFGMGSQNADIMLVGEQPGNDEDIAGTPFIGPAGKLLDQALNDAGMQREKLYVTNAVKHFKYQLVEGERHHRTPSLKEITGCKPWLEAEIAAIRPKRIICLGVSAARALIHPNFTLKADRGNWTEQNGLHMLATHHPSSILRAPIQHKEHMYLNLVEDLRKSSF